MWHIKYECPAFEACRREHASHQLRLRATAVAEFSAVAAESFARGVLPEPASLITPRAERPNGQVKWHNQPASGKLSGLLFTDGSAFFPAVLALRTAGWAIVSVDQLGDVLAAVYGDVPVQEAPTQSSRDGEDYAIRMLCWYAEPPFAAYVDCSGTIKCMTMPGPCSSSAKQTNAHMWGHFHATYEQSDFTVVKTKAHATMTDIEQGLSSHWERAANNAADSYAKKGAALAQVDAAEVNRYLACLDVARQVVIYVARAHVFSVDVLRKLQDELDSRPWMSNGPEFSVEDVVEQPLEDGVPSTCSPCASGGVVLAAYPLNGHLVVAAEIGEGLDRALLYCACCGACAEHRAIELRRLI